MKRFLIALGSITVVAAAAFIVIRQLKNKTGVGGYGIDDEDYVDECEGCSGDDCSFCAKS